MIGTFFTITSNNILDIQSTAGDLIGDFMPLIVLFVGITIAFAVYRHFKK